jgi:hypothetical protein
LSDDRTSEQSQVYRFDPDTQELSVYDPKALTLDEMSGVIATDDVVSVQTTHDIPGPSGVQSEITHGITIDRRTLVFSQFDSIQPLAYAPSTSVLTTGAGQCVKIAPQPLNPAQF